MWGDLQVVKPGGPSACFGVESVTLNGPWAGLDGTNRRSQVLAGSLRTEQGVTKPTFLHWFGWFPLQRKSCPLSPCVPRDCCLMSHTPFFRKEVWSFNSQPPGSQGRHQITGVINNVFRFLNLEGRWLLSKSRKTLSVENFMQHIQFLCVCWFL